MNAQKPSVGIDLGTTYSLIAVFEQGAPRVLATSEGTPLLPSVIAVDGKRVLVGEAARLRAVVAPQDVRATFKRDMGTNKVYTLGRQQFTSVECSALVLKELRAAAEQQLQTRVEDVVVSVPAYFGERQRNATKAAAELAGLRVLRLINEPTAAALAYGLHQRDREFKAAVLDLGGGTFDVTVLEMMEGVIEVQGSAGDVQLGGEDFLDALVKHVTAQWGAPATKLTEQDLARLRSQLEVAKRKLSDEPSVQFEFAALKRELELKTLLTRVAVEQSWEPLLERLRTPIQRALRDARTAVADVSEVLLVGGATRMPCVAALARTLFGREPSRELPADEAVALGAAVQAALIADDAAVREVVMTDIAPFTLGVEVSTKVGSHVVTGAFSPILERGTLLPASRSEVYVPLGDKQTGMLMEIFQGEHAQCSNNTLLGQVKVSGVPRGADADRSVEVRLTYDLSGVLEVDCTVLATGIRTRTVLDQSGQLTAAEIEVISKRLQSLKFHPREALPNVTLLKKAEALFVELTGPNRALLGEAISQFQAILESQDNQRIAESRTELSGFVERLNSANF